MSVATSSGLADYVRAVRKLRADPETARKIATLLQVAAPSPVPPEPVELSPETPAIQEEKVSVHGDLEPIGGIRDDRSEPVPQEPKPSVRPLPDGGLDQPSLPATLHELPRKAPRIPDIVMTAGMLPRDASVSRPQTPIPLLPKKQIRSILNLALARPSQTGPLDIQQVVEHCARGELVYRLPYLYRPTLGRGVQLLVDRGDALAVFADDQDWLVDQMLSVVGSNALQVLDFAACPTRGTGDSGRYEWVPYEDWLPLEGTVVALLTDLGIGMPPLERRAQPDEWLRFLRLLRQRRCPAVAFVPYASRRWPRSLLNSVTIIHWDWHTNTSTVHAALSKRLIEMR